MSGFFVDRNSKRQYNTHLNSKKETHMNNSFTTSKGGTVTFTATGLIHRAGQGAYSGRLAETNVVNPDAPKRGRGRPKKNT
jgi:hypothetical protein